MNPDVEISTDRYEWAHHRKPRGFGLWHFTLPDGFTVSVAAAYSRASRIAAAEARRRTAGRAPADAAERERVQLCA